MAAGENGRIRILDGAFGGVAEDWQSWAKLPASLDNTSLSHRMRGQLLAGVSPIGPRNE